MVSITAQPQADGATLQDTFVHICEIGELATNMVTLPQADAIHGSAFGSSRTWTSSRRSARTRTRSRPRW